MESGTLDGGCVSRKKTLIISLIAAALVAASTFPLIRALSSPRDNWPSDEEMMQSTDSVAVASFRDTPETEVDRDVKRVFDSMPANDKRTLDIWNPDAPHSPEAVSSYVSAARNLSPFIAKLESTDISDRIADELRSGPQPLAFPFSANRNVRHTVMLAAEVALAAVYTHDNRAAAEHIIAALRIANTLALSDNFTTNLTGTNCVAATLLPARIICRESAFDRASTMKLLAAIAATQTPETFAQGLRFIDREIRLRTSLEDYRFMVAEDESNNILFDDKAMSNAFREASRKLGITIMNKSREELAVLQKEDLAACVRLSDLVKTSPPWPYYAARENETWKKVLNHSLVPAKLPTAFKMQDYTVAMLDRQANGVAIAGTSSLMLMARLFESQNHRLPESLEELRSFALADTEIDATLDPSQSFWNDPYSGQPYKCVLTRDETGKPLSLKIYSVGPDLKDDGGQLKLPAGGMRAGPFDIGIEGKGLTEDVAK